MEKWKPLNMPIRAWVLEKALRLEQTSSAAIRAILRMFNEDSKTLGGKSSALPFKSKIDMLSDLEELTKDEYKGLIKIMEIRNQFAHNPKAVSFEALDEINKELNKFLEKIPSPNVDEKATREEKLKASFNDLFMQVAGKLLAIEIEYRAGIQKELRKHLNDQIIENLDQIWATALEKHKEHPTPFSVFMQGTGDEIESFYNHFQIEMHSFSKKELDKMEGDKIKAVFKQKKSIEEFKDEKDEKNNNS